MESLPDMCRTVADGAASAFDDAPQEFQSVLSAASDTLTKSANEIERLRKENNELREILRIGMDISKAAEAAREV